MSAPLEPEIERLVCEAGDVGAWEAMRELARKVVAIEQYQSALREARGVITTIRNLQCNHCASENVAKPNPNGYWWHGFADGSWLPCTAQDVLQVQVVLARPEQEPCAKAAGIMGELGYEDHRCGEGCTLEAGKHVIRLGPQEPEPPRSVRAVAAAHGIALSRSEDEIGRATGKRIAPDPAPTVSEGTPRERHKFVGHDGYGWCDFTVSDEPLHTYCNKPASDPVHAPAVHPEAPRDPQPHVHVYGQVCPACAELLATPPPLPGAPEEKKG